MIALYTGMRTGEIRALRWSDIDFEDKKIYVNHTLNIKKGGIYELGEPKTKSSKRTIPLLRATEETFDAVRKKQLEQRIQMGEFWNSYEGLDNLVFLSLQDIQQITQWYVTR